MENNETFLDFDEVRSLYSIITKKLIEKKLTISTMESATGGLIASLITDTEGSSAVIKGGFVTYCNEAKIMQGVPKVTIDSFSVYSKETAIAMASSCRKKYDANIGIGITGTMGNIDENNEEFSQKGIVYYSIIFDNETYSSCKKIPPLKDRLSYKLMVAKYIGTDLLEVISEY